MKKSLQIDVVSAEESIFSGTSSFVVLPGESGDLGIFPDHTPLITRIKPGEVKIIKADSNDEIKIFVAGGILEVQPEVITVLADTAIREEDLDEKKAETIKIKTEKALKNTQSKKEISELEAELAVVDAQIQMIKRVKKNRL